MALTQREGDCCVERVCTRLNQVRNKKPVESLRTRFEKAGINISYLSSPLQPPIERHPLGLADEEVKACEVKPIESLRTRLKPFGTKKSPSLTRNLEAELFGTKKSPSLTRNLEAEFNLVATA